MISRHQHLAVRNLVRRLPSSAGVAVAAAACDAGLLLRLRAAQHGSAVSTIIRRGACSELVGGTWPGFGGSITVSSISGEYRAMSASSRLWMSGRSPQIAA